MPSFIDQTGRTVSLQTIPRRIISLVPSQTELLFYFGLDAQVVGITKFCVHPRQWFKTKTRVGGTKQLNIEAIRALNPDLIIANKEENVKQQIEALEKDYSVWVSDVNNLDDAYEMIAALGEITGCLDAAQSLNTQIRERFEALEQFKSRPLRTAYFIWRNPYMTVGGDTFIHHLLTRCGLINIFGESVRYPEVSLSDLQAAGCELLLLSSEPFPFAQKHIDELQPQMPGIKILLADGEMFSWYGSRLLEAPAYLRKLLS